MTPEHLYVRTMDIVRGNLWRCFPVINVDRTQDIPCDYPGAMGVPITYMDLHNPDQFEILDCPCHIRMQTGREPYRRIIIRNLRPRLPEKIDLVEWWAKMGLELDVRLIRGIADLPSDADILYHPKHQEENYT